ncbi:hypothetical protein [Algoriphagus aquimarinus]|uniref:Uncharacterized protein n=1 Tax=Algoriphagus aquimarinus TaxID=237018 RepID=A0A5C7ARH2_9BACT|nr:hypothetical protein [Algoriphagus aquimarinus]TXE11250.1 hypothetical protein ESV85_11940 [Algoriphagus aquimarinus]
MDRVLLTLITFFLFTPCFSQMEITNVRSGAHQLVVGTELYMIPPPNFFSPGIPGFLEPASHAAVMATKVLNSNYEEFLSGFDELIGKEKVVKHVEDVLINGNKGKFFIFEEIRDGDPITNHTLFFGSDEFLYMVIGVCPSDHPGINESIKESILSVIYDSNPTELREKSFSVRTENTKLIQGGEKAGIIFYTVDGKVPTEAEDKTAFIIGSSLYNLEIVNRRTYSVNRIKQLPYKNIQVSEDLLREVKINGLDGFEFDFRGAKELDRPEEMVYSVMLFDGPKYYLLLGNAFNDFDENLKLFKSISLTFELID